MKFITELHKAVKEQLKKIKKSNKKTQTNGSANKQISDRETIYIDIKSVTVIKVVVITLLTIILASVVEDIASILLMIFIAMIFAAAIDPLVDWAEKKKVPRALSILLIYMQTVLVVIKRLAI